MEKYNEINKTTMRFIFDVMGKGARGAENFHFLPKFYSRTQLAETAEAEQGPRSAFCKPAATKNRAPQPREFLYRVCGQKWVPHYERFSISFAASSSASAAGTQMSG